MDEEDSWHDGSTVEALDEGFSEEVKESGSDLVYDKSGSDLVYENEDHSGHVHDDLLDRQMHKFADQSSLQESSAFRSFDDENDTFMLGDISVQLEHDLEDLQDAYKASKLEIGDLKSRLKKRSEMIELMRKSYLRDIVAIRHCLNDVLTEQERKDVMHEYTGRLPSIDLSGYLELYAPRNTKLKFIDCRECGGHTDVIVKDSDEVARLLKVVDRFKEQGEQLRITIATLQAEQDILEKKSESESRSHSEEKFVLYAELKKLKTSVTTTEADNKRLTRSNTQNRDEIRDLKSYVVELEAKEKRLNALEIEASQLRMDLSTATQAITVKETTINEQQREIDVEKMEVKRLQEELKKQTASVESLETSLNTVTKDEKKFRELSEFLEKSVEEKSIQIVKLEGNIEDIKEENKFQFDETNIQIENLERLTEDCKEEINKLSDELAETQERETSVKEALKAAERLIAQKDTTIKVREKELMALAAEMESMQEEMASMKNFLSDTVQARKTPSRVTRGDDSASIENIWHASDDDLSTAASQISAMHSENNSMMAPDEMESMRIKDAINDVTFDDDGDDGASHFPEAPREGTTHTKEHDHSILQSSQAPTSAVEEDDGGEEEEEESQAIVEESSQVTEQRDDSSTIVSESKQKEKQEEKQEEKKPVEAESKEEKQKEVKVEVQPHQKEESAKAAPKSTKEAKKLIMEDDEFEADHKAASTNDDKEQQEMAIKVDGGTEYKDTKIAPPTHQQEPKKKSNKKRKDVEKSEVKLQPPLDNTCAGEIMLRNKLIEALQTHLGSSGTKKAINGARQTIHEFGTMLTNTVKNLWNTLLLSRRGMDLVVKMDIMTEGILSCRESTAEDFDKIADVCKETVPIVGQTYGDVISNKWQSETGMHQGLGQLMKPSLDQAKNSYFFAEFHKFYGSTYEEYHAGLRISEKCTKMMSGYIDDKIGTLNGALVETMKDWTDAKAAFIDQDNRIKFAKSETRAEMLKEVESMGRELAMSVGRLEAAKQFSRTLENKLESSARRIVDLEVYPEKLAVAEHELELLRNQKDEMANRIQELLDTMSEKEEAQLELTKEISTQKHTIKLAEEALTKSSEQAMQFEQQFIYTEQVRAKTQKSLDSVVEAEKTRVAHMTDKATDTDLLMVDRTQQTDFIETPMSLRTLFVSNKNESKQPFCASMVDNPIMAKNLKKLSNLALKAGKSRLKHDLGNSGADLRVPSASKILSKERKKMSTINTMQSPILAKPNQQLSPLLAAADSQTHMSTQSVQTSGTPMNTDINAGDYIDALSGSLMAMSDSKPTTASKMTPIERGALKIGTPMSSVITQFNMGDVEPTTVWNDEMSVGSVESMDSLDERSLASRVSMESSFTLASGSMSMRTERIITMPPLASEHHKVLTNVQQRYLPNEPAKNPTFHNMSMSTGSMNEHSILSQRSRNSKLSRKSISVLKKKHFRANK